ncbi:hypothetical protein EDEG_01298 [Edhazardia aedis USNM 41457]|uniref:Sorting nexin-3 n=1 Tax=Edhazardia aedis (strain USNM 41457) TaxID=1003232 RepID=J9D9N4_EDHAE|nr:hypothetical protein EDEG_01298 [Edhazardia aedis USNM 41457]|eukprot:EJW04481.1 hypothetical protein EDEG_01298 [Edhazardia aedis USNM 41457]
MNKDTRKLEIYITRNRHSVNQYTEYEITTITNLPSFKRNYTVVNRRYSQFEKLNKELKKYQQKYNKNIYYTDGANKDLVIPSFPGKTGLWVNKYSDSVIEHRVFMFTNYLRFLSEYLVLCEDREWAKEFVRFLQNDTY